MNEQNQAALLEAYIAACRQDADAPVPDGLDPDMAAFVRQLMRHKPAPAQDTRPLDQRPLRERIWSNAITAANAAPQAPAQPGNPTFSPNGHHKNVERDMYLTEAESIMVLPLPAPIRQPRRAGKSPSLLTVAATLALVFIGVLAMLRLNNGDDDQFGAGIFQNETPTPMETPPNTPESDMPPTPVNDDDMPPTPVPASQLPPTPVEVVPPTPAPTNVDAPPPTPAPTSTPFPTNVDVLPPTFIPTSTPIPFSQDTRPLPCIPTEVPTITPPDWPTAVGTATPTPIGMESVPSATLPATPLPMDSRSIDCLLPTPIPVCQVIISATDGTRLRSRPTEGSALLASPELGQSMTVIFEETGVDDGGLWYLVEFEIDGLRVMGYVREDDVRMQVGSICPPPTATPIPATVLPPTLTRPVTNTPTLARPMTNTPTAFPTTMPPTPTLSPGN